MTRVRGRTSTTCGLDAIESSCFGFDLMHVGRGSAIDGDPPRLHGFRDFPQQIDAQKAVIERCAFHLHVIGKAELAFELPGRNSPIKEFSIGFLRLGAFDRYDVLFCRDRYLVRGETCNGQSDLVPVVCQPFNVVGGIVVFAGPLGGLDQIEKAVEADCRPEKRR